MYKACISYSTMFTPLAGPAGAGARSGPRAAQARAAGGCHRRCLAAAGPGISDSLTGCPSLLLDSEPGRLLQHSALG